MGRIRDSLVDSVDVATRDDQLAVIVTFRRDAEFKADEDAFNKALEAHEDVLEQPATRRSQRIVVTVTDTSGGGGPRTDFRIFSGGTGTETIAEWRFDRDTTRTTYNVSVQADGRTIFHSQCVAGA